MENEKVSQIKIFSDSEKNLSSASLKVLFENVKISVTLIVWLLN